MTKQIRDDEMTGIAGGGGLEDLSSRLSRILTARANRDRTTLPTPGGPGPGPETESESDGLGNLMMK